MSENLENILHERDIKPTAMRLLIVKTMLSFSRAFSLSDLEAELGTVDKSTLFRAITLFRDRHLIHSIDDGSGSMKYSVCRSECDCNIDDMHAHFYCLHCHNTVCLESTAIPDLKIPKGMTPTAVNLVIKGYCKDCGRFAT